MELKTMKLSDYTVRTYDKIRYRDTDRQGHVNNAVFATFLETGRVEFLYNPEKPLYKEGCTFVIASVNTNLIGEITWPGTVDIGTAITRIGNSSFSIIQGLYQNEKIVATSETVIVQMDEMTRKSSPLSDTSKQELEQYMI